MPILRGTDAIVALGLGAQVADGNLDRGRRRWFVGMIATVPRFA